MKLEFVDFLTNCNGGELLGITRTSGGNTELVILKNDGDIVALDIDYIHKCKIVNKEINSDKKHR